MKKQEQMDANIRQVLRDCKAILKGFKSGMTVNLDYVTETLNSITAVLNADIKKEPRLFV